MSTRVEQWLATHARPPAQIDMGLERVKAVRQRLALTLPSPQITVGGTNGKGSVCRLLAAMLTAGGFRVGCYTSPHLLHFGERVNISGANASDDDMLAALQAVHNAAQHIDAALTYFELTTLAAALLFSRANCDIVILEVGLGGRLDAVNVFDADVAVITNIGIDHCEYLGSTRDAIAGEKAGICRANRPVVVGDDAPPPMLAQAIEKAQAQPHYIGRDFFCDGERHWRYRGTRTLASLPSPALAGAHQRTNAAIALRALECLSADYWPGTGAVRKGLHTVELPGRAQVLPGRPCTVLDVAHNPAAATMLERQLFAMGYYPRTTAVLGMLARKDITGFVDALARRIDHWHIAQPSNGDLPADAINTAVRSALHTANSSAGTTTHRTIAAAAAAAAADSGEDGRIVITGSFLTVADYSKAK